jgi:hypothetical protein
MFELAIGALTFVTVILMGGAILVIKGARRRAL